MTTIRVRVTTMNDAVYAVIASVGFNERCGSFFS